MFQMLFLVVLLKVAFAHMSMQYPYPRDKLNGTDYAVWQQNEPMYSVHPTVCHSLDKDTTIRSGNSFTAGTTIAATIYGSASHNGGHCAFWWSTDEITWTKIIDLKDCTLNSTANVLIPKSMSTQCATSCVFAWTWSPVSSGLCEIYMNCADIKVTGVTGPPTNPIQVNFGTILANSNCSRVDETTHFTTIFGALKTSYLSEDYYGTNTSSGTTTTTTTKSPVVQSTVAVDISDNSYCANTNAPNVEGSISNVGYCVSNGGYRCDDGQCCSKSGYCGPELAGYDNNGDPLYYYYPGNGSAYIWGNSSAAVDAYCNDNTGDWRLVKCSSLTTSGSNNHFIQISSLILMFVLMFIM